VSGKAWGSPDGKRSLFTQLRRHGETSLDTPRLVSDLLWEQEAASSNLAIPTISAVKGLAKSWRDGSQDRLTVI
jgi:hypothetical protein